MEKHLNDDKIIIFLNQFSENVCNNITHLYVDLHIAATGIRRTMIILAKLYRFYYYYFLFLLSK
jgi:hypothetical protein